MTVAAISCIEYARDAGLYGLAKATVGRVSAVYASLPSDGQTALKLRFERVRLTSLAGDIAAAEAEYRALLDIHRRLLHDVDLRLWGFGGGAS